MKLFQNVVFAILLTVFPTDSLVRGDTPVSPLADEIILSIGYVKEHCDAEGRFVYCVSGENSDVDPAEYNQVRHAGAIYALSQAHDWAVKHDPSVLAEIESTMKRAAGYMLKRVGPVPGADDAQALWSPTEERDPVSEGGILFDEAKLGATGLALVGLCAIEHFEPGFTPRETLRGLGRFLRRMTLSDGSTLGSLDAQGRVKTLVSLYYPGEAALGLCALHRHDPDGPWLETAKKLLLYLGRNGSGAAPDPLDHWIPIAVEDFFELTGPPTPNLVRSPAPDRRLFGKNRNRAAVSENPMLSRSEHRILCRHAVKIAEEILEAQIVDPNEPFCGAFDSNGALCPGSTRLEGLQAILKLLPDNEFRSLKDRAEKSVDLGIRFLRQHQIADGPNRGGIPHAADAFSAAEIRIDFVQHFLSALIAFDRRNGTADQR